MPADKLLFACDGVDQAAWLDALAKALPDLEIRVWPDVGDPADIAYALLWKRPAAILSELPNLRIVFSMGAGVESLLTDPDLPRTVPLVRMIDPSLAEGMREYVTLRVLHHHRRIPEFDAAQQAGIWRPLVAKRAEDQRVGLLGLGELGRACARDLVRYGFDVAGWARTKRRMANVTVFHGKAGLEAFLARTDILICLLPLTPETENIIDARTLAMLPDGASVINVARGRHLVESDLVDALNAGKISFATLDVFREEPLPPDHVFWHHPRVAVTPHCSALTNPETAAQTLAANIRSARETGKLTGTVDRTKGY